MKLWYRATLILALVAFQHSAYAQETTNKEELLKIVEKISKQHQQLTEEINHLKRRLGATTVLDGLIPLSVSKTMPDSVRTQTEEGRKTFKKNQFTAAKNHFQKAWEDGSNNAITNYNLGLAYHCLGKKSLAKRMLKSAIEIDPKIKGAKQVRKFLSGDVGVKSDPISEEEKKERNELINLKKEARSYLSSSTLPVWKRIQSAACVLDEMVQKAQGDLGCVEEHFVWIGETYAAFEWYDRALKIFDIYEEKMEGQVLPDGYYNQRLAVAEKKKQLDHYLQEYTQQIDQTIRRRLGKDFRELTIFAAQIEEFVQNAEVKDVDFSKICKRLSEYRWGGRSNRHVMVVDRFQQLLYSSLPGTLPINRYQDNKGQQFLKNITLLADQVDPKDAQLIQVKLNLNGKIVPYVVMFSYIPKHELFIIVRMAKKDIG